MKKFLLALFIPIYIGLCLVLYTRLNKTPDKSLEYDNQRIYTFLKNLESRKKITTTSTNQIILPEVSLESIFSSNHSVSNRLPDDKKVVIIATGDVLPARSVNTMVHKLNNFKWPYEKTADFLKSADLTYINLETPLINNCPLTDSGMIFCGDPNNIEGLLYAGIDIANIANNHANNHGYEGIVETEQLLTQSGISVTGNSNIVYKELKGMVFAFLGFNDIGPEEKGILWADKENISAKIQEARKNADIVIVSYHWGAEYRAQPDARQIELGHFTIDSGADLIIGNHPHWIQPVEIYKGKLITYAHGNFVFDQMWSQKTEEGILGKYTFYDKKLVDVEFSPITIKDYGQPYFPEEKEKQRILGDLKTQSFILSKDAPN